MTQCGLGCCWCWFDVIVILVFVFIYIGLPPVIEKRGMFGRILQCLPYCRYSLAQVTCPILGSGCETEILSMISRKYFHSEILTNDACFLVTFLDIEICSACERQTVNATGVIVLTTSVSIIDNNRRINLTPFIDSK